MNRPPLARLRRYPVATAGGTVLALLVLIALFAPAIAPYGPHATVGQPYQPPSSAHWLGLDDAGHDMLSLLIWGARTSLLVGFAAAFVAIAIGGTLGVLGGYFGGALDVTSARVTDYFLAIPVVPLILVAAAVWGHSLGTIILIIAALSWMYSARVVRAEVKSVRERTYVKRARALGAGNARIVLRHVLPQVAPLLVAQTVLTVALAIFAEAAIAFLGFGDPTVVSWGKLIQNAFNANAVTVGAWWAIVPPGVMIAIVVLSCTMLGTTVENAMNPRLRSAHLTRGSFRIRTLAERDA
jgi:peptide/nickel transport system permease protein